MRDRFGAIGERKYELPRQPHGRRPAPDLAGDLAQHVAQKNIFVRQGCSARRYGLSARPRMPNADIVDMNEIQPSIDIGRHAARRRLDDDPSSRRRADVARSNWRRRIDDDGRQACSRHHGLDQALGGDLAVFVSAEGAFRGDRNRLVARRPSGRAAKVATLDVYTMRSTPAASAACITEPGAFDIGIARCLRDFAPIAGNPQRRETDNGRRSWRARSNLHRRYRPRRSPVGDRRDCPRTGGTNERAHRVVGLQQIFGDGRTDKTARARD